MVQTAETVWRDFVTNNVPSSGVNNPDKVEIRKWGTWVETIFTAVITSGGKLYASKAAMDADTAPAINTPAIVLGDATAANNGLYRKSAAAGTAGWTRVGDVPGYSYITATNAGAGTANAIQATTSIPIPAADGGALIALPIVADNTASPVTVAFNGGAALTIKTSSGSDVVAGGLTAGMVVAGYVSGSTFRLLSDQASAAIVTAAEAAAARAEAAAASIQGLTFPSVALASAYTPDAAPEFIRTAGYGSAGDGGGALYKKVAAEPVHEGKLSITLSDGVTTVWYELAERIRNPAMFGGFGAAVTAADGATTTADTTFTSASAAFSASDVGKVIAIAGAGAAGAQLVTTIASINSPTSIELAAVASTTVAGANYAYGADDTAACANMLAMGGGTFAFLADRNYLINSDTELSIPANSTIFGWGSRLTLTNNAAPRPLIHKAANDSNVIGLTVVGTGAGVKNGFSNFNSSRIRWEYCTAIDCGFYGFAISQDTVTGVATACNDNSTRFCRAEGCGYFGFEYFPKVKSKGLLFEFNVAIDCGKDNSVGSGFKVGTATEKAIVRGNYAEDCLYSYTIATWEDLLYEDNVAVNSNRVELAISPEDWTDGVISYIPGLKSLVVKGFRAWNTDGFTPSNTVDPCWQISPSTSTNPAESITIEDCDFRTPSHDFGDAQPGSDINELIFRRNRFKCAGLIQRFWNTSGGDIGLTWEDNYLDFEAANSVNAQVSIKLDARTRIVRGRLRKAGQYPLRIKGSEIVVDDMTFEECNISAAATSAAVLIEDATAVTHRLRRLKVANNGSTGLGAFVSCASAVPTIYSGPHWSDSKLAVETTSTPNIVTESGGDARNNARAFWGTAAPTTGTYGIGDIVWNTAPSASGNIGWVCTAGGVPGTWKTFGTIAA